MPNEKTAITADKKGGLLDKLINGGELPEVKVKIENDTLVHIGIMIVVSVTLSILISILLKQTLLKGVN